MKIRITESDEGRPKPSRKILKTSTEYETKTLPEAILVEILARFPLRNIARFKSVCKTWKSTIESSYFRRVFISLHKDSSSSWSLLFGTEFRRPITEAIGFHGCESWDLPKSLGSYILPDQRYTNLTTFDYSYVASSNGLIWIDIAVARRKNRPYKYRSFVGNPVLQQWVEIPPPPDECIATGLVTRVEDGKVVSFKVVRTCEVVEECEDWCVYVYSSETGTWSFKRLLSSIPVSYASSYPHVSVDGVLYLWESDSHLSEFERIVAYDFYGEEGDDRCRVIPVPVPDNKQVRRCLTSSGGDVFYIEMLYRRLKVWRMNNGSKSESSEWWKLAREEIDIAAVGFDVHCAPLAMNPFDSDIVYLWSRQHYCLVSGNLRTQEFIVHQQSENWKSSEGFYRINTSDSKGYMEPNRKVGSVVMLSQFVLPPWMDSVPRPPN